MGASSRGEATSGAEALPAAATRAGGMFSAGAVWVALHLIQGCINSPTCHVPDPRFQLIAGTSGAR